MPKTRAQRFWEAFAVIAAFMVCGIDMAKAEPRNTIFSWDTPDLPYAVQTTILYWTGDPDMSNATPTVIGPLAGQTDPSTPGRTGHAEIIDVSEGEILYGVAQFSREVVDSNGNPVTLESALSNQASLFVGFQPPPPPTGVTITTTVTVTTTTSQ